MRGGPCTEPEGTDGGYFRFVRLHYVQGKELKTVRVRVGESMALDRPEEMVYAGILRAREVVGTLDVRHIAAAGVYQSCFNQCHSNQPPRHWGDNDKGALEKIAAFACGDTEHWPNRGDLLTRDTIANTRTKPDPHGIELVRFRLDNGSSELAKVIGLPFSLIDHTVMTADQVRFAPILQPTEPPTYVALHERAANVYDEAMLPHDILEQELPKYAAR